MDEQEKEDLIKQLQGEVLEVFNERLIRAGINDGAEAIYIASMAIAQAAAVLIWSQLPLDGITPDVREGLLDDWCELYKGYSRELLEKRKHGYNGEPITKRNTKEGGVPTWADDDDTDGSADTSAWSRRREREE